MSRDGLRALFAMARFDGAPVDDAEVDALSQRLVHVGPYEARHRPAPGMVLGLRSRSPLEAPAERPGVAMVVCDGRRIQGAAAVGRGEPDALAGLAGDGAFIHVDPRRGRLTAVVDHVATSPLYWSRPTPNCVVVGPEPQALLGIGGTSTELDEGHLVGWVAGLDPQPEATFFRAVRRVPAGHALVADAHGDHLRRWWTLPEAGDPAPAPSAAARALRLALESAVADRLPTDGLLALELSGGLDSSAIFAVASSQLTSAGPLLAYTYGPAEEPGWDFFDEVPLARLAASVAGCPVEQTVFRTSAAPVRVPLQRPAAVDHPGSSADSFTALAQRHAARSGATVLLSGWGGDYAATDHGGPAQLGHFLAGRWGPLWRDLQAGIGADPRASRSVLLARTSRRFTRTGLAAARAALAARGVGPTMAAADLDRYLGRCCLAPEVAAAFAVRRRLAAPDRSAIDLAHRRRRMFDNGVVVDRIEQERRTSIAAGIEMGYPLLDRRLVELVATMPDGFFHRDGWGRWVFREAMRGVLPEELRLRRDKLGGASDGPRSLARRRLTLVARAEAHAQNPTVTRLLDVGSLRAQLAALPDEETLRDCPDHGATHPALQRRGALLRALAAADFLAGTSSR